MRGLGFVIRLARASLLLYPASFRASHDREFVDAIAHRWHRERRATNSAFRATLRACLILCADTAASAPGFWRQHDSQADARRPRRWLSGWGADLRLAARHTVRQPLAALLVVLTLGLGLGLGVASFSALDRIVLRPLPGPKADRLFYAGLLVPSRGWRLSPHQAVLDRWRAGARTIVQLETYSPGSVVRTGDGAAAMIEAVAISGGLPSLLSATPLVGRMLGPADAAAAAAPAAMLSERTWRRDYGADPGVIGRSLRLNATSYTIVGVWPDRTRFQARGIPDVIRVAPDDEQISRGGFGYAFVELADGATPDAASRELTALLDGVADLMPGSVAAVLPPAQGLHAPAFVTGLWMVFIAGALLMLVAVVNSANVLLGRAASRAGELGVRLALGASVPRVIRLFLAESLVLVAAGTALGAGVATAATRLSSALAPAALALADGGWAEARPMLFGAAAAALATMACALIPVWRVRALSVRGVLASASGSRTIDGSARLHAWLIGAQAAMAVLLVAGAALMSRSLRNVAGVDPGFDIDRLATVVVQAPEDRYPLDEAAEAFTARVLEAFAALPGVERATVSGSTPFRASRQGGEPFLDGEPPPPDVPGTFSTWQTAPPGYFATLGIPFVAGREFTAGDTGVVIVNESFARAHGGSVIGRRLRFARDKDAGREIVGVVRDIQSGALIDRTDRVQLYSPDTGTGRYTHYVLRTSGPPEALLPLARARLAELDPDVPLRMATTGPELFADEIARHRFMAMLLASLATLGVVFAISGVYGTVVLDVGRRVREMGLRLALGATGRDVIAGVIGRGLRPVVAGGLLGGLAAAWAGPYLEDLLFQVPARDPWSLAAGFALVSLTAVLASSLPARRASRVDPTITLRAQ
ncbi:MAG TPA: ABC transporter permease [Vicinamibacterales bacterium]|nr:ABC transporter permease [Vicinamibacterales bacterium]